MSELTWYQLAGLGFVQVSGTDARDYLHRMTTNAVKPMVPGDVRRSLLLRGDGRLVADFYCLCEAADRFLLVTPFTAREGLLAQLDMFLFTEKVEISDASTERHALCLQGPGASAALERLCPEASGGNQLRSGDGVWGFLCPDAPLARPKAIIWTSPNNRAEALASLDNGFGPEADSDTVTRLRIEDGEPLFGTDMDSTTIPLEARLTHAIDFAKGCFPGQEIVARIENLGHPANVLVGLEASSIGPGDLLFVGEKQIGRVTSVASLPSEEERSIALGYVKWDFRLPGTVVQVQGAGEATVLDLPLAAGPERQS